MEIKRAFSIGYDDELGPLWMNEDNLLMCLNGVQHCAEELIVSVEDITEHVAELEEQFAIVVERNEVLEATLKLFKEGIGHVLPRPYEPEKRVAP
jgi:hypothetical protein